MDAGQVNELDTGDSRRDLVDEMLPDTLALQGIADERNAGKIRNHRARSGHHVLEPQFHDLAGYIGWLLQSGDGGLVDHAKNHGDA
jgi:hypothetical protein